jgi:hypothetical protein
MLIVYSNKLKGDNELVPTESLTDEDIEKLSKEAGKKEKEFQENNKPYVPTQEDLDKLQELFQKNYGLKKEDVEVTPTETIVPTPEPTPEPSYFVDDEPVMVDENKPNRLVYKKDE